VDEPGNEHYWDDFQLEFKSLVIVLVKDKKIVQWKNLKDVWTLLDDEDQFHRYVSENVASYLKEV